MLPIQKKLQLIFLGLACSVVAVLAVETVLDKWPAAMALTKTVNLFFYEFFFKPTLRPPQNLVIIDRGDPSASLNRSEYASMIRQLHHAGAKCIALDVVFLGRNDHNRQGDRELVNSFAEAPEAILAIDFLSTESSTDTTTMLMERLALPDSLCQFLRSEVGDFYDFPAKGVSRHFDSLFAAAQRGGHVNNLGAEYHHVPLVMTFQQKCYPAFAVAIAKLCAESEGRAFSWTKLYQDAMDDDGQLLINFIPVSEFVQRSWSEASARLRSRPEEFRDTVVIIVNSLSSFERRVKVSIDRNYPKWALLASATSQLLLDRNIECSMIFAPAFFSAFLVLLGILWLLVVAPRLTKKWQKTRLIFIAGAGLFLLLIFLLLNLGRQWIGVGVPLLVFNISMLVVRKVYYRMIKSPQYLDFGLAVLERRGEKYPIQVFESPVGVDTSDISFDSFLEEEKFQDTIDRIKDWRASREDIRWIGDKLHKALFQSEVYHLLQNSLNQAENENKYVRLRLRIDAPELVCLPWELMHSSDLDSEYIALHKRLSLVRYLPLARPPRKSQYHSPLKILVFISRSRTSDLDIRQEKKNIKKALRPLIWSLDVRMRICEQATLENLSRELERHPDILHYIGHADFDDQQNEAYLEFESEQKVFARTLKGLLAESSIKLAVLNSCKTAAATKTDAFTGIAQNLVKVGIPAVVAMQLKIPDDTAAWFSEIFYSKLLHFYSIAIAVAETRRKIMERTELDQQHWATPVLFMREGEPILFDPG